MTDGSASPRLPLVDTLRGVGIVMMVVYHGAWDLSWFGYLATDVGTHPAWKAFAWLTAGLFLLMVGTSLVLANARGIDRRRFLRRVAVVAAAAALVSVATRWLFGETWIFFGILHHIALASVLGLAFLRAPAWLSAGAAPVALLLPHAVSDPLFDQPALQWIGLGTVVPASNDFVPLFPWFAPVLAGIAVGRLLLSTPRLGRVAAGATGGPRWRWLRAAGRHSLLVYLLHQPLLYGATAALAAAWPAPRPVPDAAALMQRCVSGCRDAGGFVAACELRCTCAEETLGAENLWVATMTGRVAAGDQQRVIALLSACAAR